MIDSISNFFIKGKYKKQYREAKKSYLLRIRWAVSLFYFAFGLCFASWASRIPDIKTALFLSDAELGNVLFALPLGQLSIMPFSGKIVTKFGSHLVLRFSILFYILCFIAIGLAQSIWQLALILYFFGIFGNLNSISVNTQGIYAERLYRKNIMSSFHGLWSLAGFSGALIGTAMIRFKLNPHTHFIIIAVLVLFLVGFNYKFLIKAKESIKHHENKRMFFKPDLALVSLGIIAFCCMASEGIMFDWSGVYFKDIVKPGESLVILGYTSFMIAMASGRLFGEKIIHKFGRKKVIRIGGILVSIGLFTAVIFPYLVPSTLAFMVVGLGVSTIIPTIYSLAGKNKTMPSSESLTVVASIGFLGFLLGPPVIGHIASLFGLRYSFAFIGIFGILIFLLVGKLKAIE